MVALSQMWEGKASIMNWEDIEITANELDATNENIDHCGENYDE